MTATGDRSASATLRAWVGPTLRRGLAWSHALSGRSARARRRLDGSCAAVLMYHRVLPRSEARRLHVEPGMYVTPETFARHLGWLADAFAVLPLPEIVARLETGDPLPPRACAISFDDGWRDNLDHALPALVARRMPATIFVVTDRVGTDGAFWPDEVARRLAQETTGRRVALLDAARLTVEGSSLDAILAALKTMPAEDRDAALERLRYETRDPIGPERELLDWTELDRLAGSGIAIESHSASHAILTGVSRDVVQTELARSLATLQAHGHARHALLAYPSGAFDRGIVEIARSVGYRAAVTTEVGLASGADDPLALPRVAVHEDIARTRAEFFRWIPGSARARTAKGADRR
ncbi:MAG: polysaccharide deacetylase family protein [Myxococcota bacterium]